MNRLARFVERLRLASEILLYRHGPWWPLLAALGVALVLFASIVLPQRAGELAAQQEILAELQARAAVIRELPSAPPAAATRDAKNAQNFQAFQATLVASDELLSSIRAVLDAAASHQLASTRAEYAMSQDTQAGAASLQMTVPVVGRYGDVRRWLEEILARRPFVAVNEIGFKRDEIASHEIEARVRLSLWHHPLDPTARARALASIDP